MKKRLLSLALVLLLCLSLLPAAVLAAGETKGNQEENVDIGDPPVLTGLSIVTEGSAACVEIQLETTSAVRNLMSVVLSFGRDKFYGGIELQLSVDGEEWQKAEITQVSGKDQWVGVFRSEEIPGLQANSQVSARIRYYGENTKGKAVYSEWSEVLAASAAGGVEPIEFITLTASDWAMDYVEKALELGLVPEALLKEDLTQPITRQEFAAVSVRVFEALSGSPAAAAEENPFTDTADADVLKAVDIGITNGMTDTTFAPEELLNREQASTMLSRAYKRLHLEGWTLKTDPDHAEEFHGLFEKPDAFVDDGDISAWAMDSVYFMAANGILTGFPDGTFLPQSYATREQALVIALRMVQNLK